MAIKTILAISGTEQGDGDLGLAERLCDQVGAHLCVLVLAIAAPPPVGEYGALASRGWVDQRDADIDRLRQRVASLKTRFSDRATGTDLTAEYAEAAWADDVVAQRARYADLTLIGPDLLANRTLGDRALEGALFSSGRPLLLVPDGPKATLAPRRVLVAWDGRMEAARAVRESLDLLVGAEAVHLVLVDPAEGPDHHGEEPGADAATYLARHGVAVTVERLPSSGHSVAQVLKRHALDMAAELLVMGAYGHSRLRERIFGGVTHSMLEAPPLPVLMAR